MKITDVQMNGAAEIRFIAEYNGVIKLRFFGIAPGDDAVTIAAAMAKNIEHFVELVETNGFKPYNTEEHIAGIMRDAKRYGTD